MIATGEPLGLELVRKWYAGFPGVKLLNAYGPTEASDDVTHYEVALPTSDQVGVPIGKPIQNTHLYILDANLNLCPIGVKGEICVAGLGVGRGYWKNEALTKRVFIANPVLTGPGWQDYRLVYRTGDQGYYQEDGHLMCTGRVDDQVKIRGFRIELGEIESRLLKYDAIKEAVVIPRQEGADKYLAAYYVAEREIVPTELKHYLQEHLPGYMVPNHYQQLAQLPLTTNGKLDKQALPAPGIWKSDAYVPPSNEIEERLAAIWADVLEVEKAHIGINTSFFALGGHSLKAIKLLARIEKQFNTRIQLASFFLRPTIAEMGKMIQVTSLSKRANPSYNIITI
jgi:acyl-coenzyme A synthetase/AMP-(fatty) acid ligase/acyl carrier protein